MRKALSKKLYILTVAIILVFLFVGCQDQTPQPGYPAPYPMNYPFTGPSQTFNSTLSTKANVAPPIPTPSTPQATYPTNDPRYRTATPTQPTLAPTYYTPPPTTTPLIGNGYQISYSELGQTLLLQVRDTFTVMRFQNASIKNDNPYLLKQISGAPDITQGDQVYQAVATGEAYLLFTIYHPCPSLPPGEVCMGPPPDQRNLHVIVRESGMSTPTAFPYPPEEIPTVPWQPKNVSQVEIQTVGEYSLEQVANQLLREWFYQYSDPRADENWKIQSFSISKINIQEIPTVEPDQIENYAVHIESSLMPVNRTVSAWNSLEGKPEPGDWISFTEDVKLVKTATFFRLMIPFPK